jgi:FAD:protein FMN transferase
MADAAAGLRVSDPVTVGWEALGTGVVVRVAEPADLGSARAAVEVELRAIDRAASRFRADSELNRLNAAGGQLFPVSRLLLEAIDVALAAAVLTDGAVDPTLGDALVLAGYTTDWRELEPPAAERSQHPARPCVVRARRRRIWEEVELRRDPPAVRLPTGVRLDLGATAKALATDRAARAAANATRNDVLVSLGGDIATAGPGTAGGWLVHVTDDHRSPPAAPGQTVRIDSGGLATSSTTVRRWSHAGRTMHHILDPANGQPVTGPWRTASVAAASCVDANTASTASIVLGHGATNWLAETGLAARLVAHDGRVETVGDWPT